MISIEERGIPVPDDSRKTRPQNCPVKVGGFQRSMQQMRRFLTF
jgi:hypothetical protein